MENKETPANRTAAQSAPAPSIRTRKEQFGTIEYDLIKDTFSLKSSWPLDGLEHQELSAPLTMHWITTMKCNARCPYCYELDFLLKKTDKEEILSKESCTQFIGNYAAAGGFRLYLTGGEPTLHPFLAHILKTASEHDVATVINTNGIEMPSDIYDALKVYHGRLSVSLDSDVKEVHDQTRKQRSYDNIITLISRASQDRIPVRVISVLTDKTIKGVESMGRYLQDLGAQSWFLQPLTAEYAASKTPGVPADAGIASSSQLERRLQEALPALRVRVLPAIYDSFMYILPDGSVGKSIWTPQKQVYGNVAHDDIKSIWQKNPARYVGDHLGILHVFDAPSRGLRRS